MRLLDSFKYGAYQLAGQIRQRWIEDSTASGCPIEPSKLSWQDLTDFHNDPTEPDLVPVPYDAMEDHLDELQIQEPDEGGWARMSIQQLGLYVNQWSGKQPRLNVWKGQVAPGVLMIEEIKRTFGPYASEISAAAYATTYPIDTLKCVYLFNILNEDTRGFMQDYLYTAENGLEWYDETELDWYPGSPEFEALLGTRLGGLVVNLILGSLERGTRRISKIRTFFCWGDLHMRLMIEEIPKNTKGESAQAAQPVSGQKRKRSTSPISDDSPIERPHKRRCFDNQRSIGVQESQGLRS
ncbi:hypothetical protein N7541_006173 [Penicillium brevicompactum]|uniref:Uncharacterized protein n=1 Tax=Penicillium brevicompactum TaxID=5074 RepID=A0A9W9R6N6_PENBR|nr:hypothetical protein N7541_006173 [Penicillium brevicompactum]